MNNDSPVRKGLFQLLYSVIETGVCRVITSKSEKLLASLKKTYIENIPEHHQVVFLPGKIEHLDDLTRVLVTAGIDQFSSIENNQQFLENAKQYLIENKDKEVITIWAFENADLIASDIHDLLGQLLAWQRYGSSLLTIELWGHTLLEKLYSSGEISQYYQSKIYPINLDENLTLKSKIALFNFKSINFKLFIALMAGLLLGPQVAPLLEKLSNIYNSSTQPTINVVNNINTEKLAPKAIAVKPAFDDENNKQAEITRQANVLALNDSAEFKENGQNLAITLASNTDETNKTNDIEATDSTAEKNINMHNIKVAEHILTPEKPHWYFKLLPIEWLSDYNINLNHQLQTENNQVYIQYGVYKHKRSVIRFATENRSLSDYYHLCYSSEWQMVALMTGAYQDYRQAFKSLIKIKEQGFDGIIVNSSYLNAWQCSNQN
ncbi:hypothetical protein H4J51_09055 [Colwellia sp. MB02u-18]|uniref:hypothetical protein n=1 Tax=unclassified Colwellia TaxID=196834 RepID=UPI0015F375C8|nr:MULTISPECIES: hypothetical protein [unclassified Colwellia]MBA6225298.1 hypothetical protein [Colwellia sp. MB3u-45]MBA6267252.1 hypothetical protein [Colwellia sp. MB3u-43]MBA6322864.1 hypothetical protein [Colwellia sp. MB02u-19]MBA6324728.1 hypothetical protein [Colwellia sp. MB02u-18]MBA6331081.1 hypothetical protein [Colwellia sp. MB02u-12]